MINFIVEAKCPECGTINEVSMEFTDKGYGSPMITICEPSEGGCDKYFAVKATLTATAKTAIVGAGVQ